MKRLLLVLVSIQLCACLWASNIEKSIKVKNKYINIPIESAQNRQRVLFEVNGEVFTYNDIRLASDKVDYWTFVDVSAYKGKTLTFSFEKDVKGIDKMYQSDNFVGEETIYEEPLRPQIHYTTKRGWNNDPNGLVYYNGEYHLYYQHNPYETKWGNMTWGHAVSQDLLHWEELSPALFPDELGVMYSGSAVIDYNNTAGLNKDDTPTMIAVYTVNKSDINQQQCMAYSYDNGRTFTKYDANPVIPATRYFGSGHERDPKVFWYAPKSHWVMILHEGLNLTIFTSDNLKDWIRQSSIKVGMWECPELFQLPVDGDEKNMKWVVYAVQGTYLVGEFDGKVFTPETPLRRYNTGGMTAAQSYNDEPKGRRVQIGWGHAEFPAMPFAQTFTFPQECKLKTIDGDLLLHVQPVEEIKELYTKSYIYNDEYISTKLNDELAKINSPFLHIKSTFRIENGRVFGLDINGYKLVYNVSTNKLNDVFVPLIDGEIDIEILVDNSLIEVFINGGRYYWFENYNGVNIDQFRLSLLRSESSLNQNSKTLIKRLEINELKSIWE